MYWRSSGPIASSQYRKCPTIGKFRITAWRFCTMSWIATSTSSAPNPMPSQPHVDTASILLLDRERRLVRESGPGVFRGLRILVEVQELLVDVERVGPGRQRA